MRARLAKRSADRQRPNRSEESGEARLWHIGVALAVAFTTAILGLAALTLLAWTLLSHPKIAHSTTVSLHDAVSVLQLVFASVAGAGALVALIVAYRRQKIAEADSAHDRTRVFNERFIAITAQLGDDKPAIRLAGVHAMAGLADDWNANRQTCIDVLCAYLRIPYEPDPGPEAPTHERLAFQASREVRHTVIRVIAAHLTDDASVSWQERNFDFTGVVFDGGSFANANFSGGQVSFRFASFSGGMVNFGSAQFRGAQISFDSAEFSGSRVNFSSAEFSGGEVSFSAAKFSGGEVKFTSARFCGAEVSFSRAKFCGAEVSFDAEFSGGQVDFGWAKFSDIRVNFGFATFSGTEISFSFAEFPQGRVLFDSAKFSGSEVSFSSARFSGALVVFNSAQFSGGRVSFDFAEFSDGMVYFVAAKFSGGQLDFSRVREWSTPPTFDWGDQPAAAGVELPSEEHLRHLDAH